MKKNIQAFLLTSGLFATSIYGYLQFTAIRNYKEFKEKQDNEVQFKDNTRPQNQYFGLSYGFRADQIVLDKLDTGDFLFLKFECMECISVQEMVKCLYWTNTKPYPHYDSFGIVYRDHQNVYVLYDKFGEIVVEDYAQFLQNPFWSEITIRKLIGASDIQKSLKNFFYDETLLKGLNQQNYINTVLEDNHIIHKQSEVVYIEDLDVDESPILKGNIRMGPKINVRTKRNRDLEHN